LAACLLLRVVWTTQPGAFAPAGIIGKRRALTLSVFAAAFGLTILVAGQVMMKKQFYRVSTLLSQAGSRPGQISLHDGRFNLNPADLPRVGSSSATNFIVCLFDYTCSHCRALHPLLKAAEQKYPGRLGIVSLPVPLDAACNPAIIVTSPANNNACEYARLSLALWHSRPEAFRIFDDWMFDSPTLPPLAEARAKAEALAGKETMEQALADPWVERQLQTDIAIYQANAHVTGDLHLPQIVIGKVVIHGAMDNLDDLLRLIRQHARLD
jgi:protein-disulfide isomerase